ncbi:MAG: hypothetical protein HY891_10970, partial [Deltaproteobacteria bacterium]|nr:hypothetical protein [Deltaproteobacteria bacterium]
MGFKKSGPESALKRERHGSFYSTVTLLARFLGWSTSVPLRTAIWYARS